ncbi:MAG: agmatine deiminase family protein [Candidatus Gastranaerophilales bacterium]|nr:agmatine deiminase family protein [Candidatus Gastranaerophilales bacterium]
MYPFRTDIWRNNAEHMRNYILELVSVIAKYEVVYLVCRDCDLQELRPVVPEGVVLVPMEYDDIWARDIGPTFIREAGKIKCINWKFNSWGGVKEGSYHPWDKDNAFATEIASYLGLEVKDVKLVFEGGAFLTDGEGTVFTTRSVILNRNRNPFKSLQYVDELLKESLFAERIVWLKQGLAFDETNGHIDNVMSIVRPHEICLAWTDDKTDPNYKRLRRAEQQINENYECIIHKIPLPTAQYMAASEASGLTQNDNAIDRESGDLLPASYLNYYYVNGGVIIPVFGCPEDDMVMELYKNIFSDRQIESIYSREPLLGGGGIHCILHEIPKLG